MPDDLRAWAELHAPKGNLQAKQVLELLDNIEFLKAKDNHCFKASLNFMPAPWALELSRKLKAAELAGRHAAERVKALEAELSFATIKATQVLFDVHTKNDKRVKALEADLAQARETIRQLQACVEAQEERMVESLPSRDAPVAP